MTNGTPPGYLATADCRLADLIQVVGTKTDLAEYPQASAVEQNVLTYEGAWPGPPRTGRRRRP